VTGRRRWEREEERDTESKTRTPHKEEQNKMRPDATGIEKWNKLKVVFPTWNIREHWNILERVLFSAEMPSVSFSSGLARPSMSNIQAFPSSCNAAAWRGVHCGPFSFRKAGEAIESNKVFRMFTSGFSNNF